jgi:hypothetical protein
MPFLKSILAMLTAFSIVSGSEQELGVKAIEILQNRCFRCHGGSAKQAGLDVLSRESLVEKRGDPTSPFSYIVPNDIELSQLLDSIQGDDSYMPKDGSPEAKAMTASEKMVIRDWVAAGAVFPKRRNAEFVSEKRVLSAIRQHLLSMKADDRHHFRFFTLAHLQNNDSVSEMDLRYYRAALSKATNSLSNERELHIPQPLPETFDSVFVVDLRRLGWRSTTHWDPLIGHYPYGLKYDYVRDDELKQLGKDVALLSGVDLSYLRADWFVVTATQPTLYHTLLDIPMHLQDLEHRLGVDLKEDFTNGKMQRAGFAKSGVSKQNRLLERHTSRNTPYFWISWDFFPRKAKGDLLRFPLGPVFEENPYRKQAFQHDGGEIIWSLPNGLQAYMLVKDDGSRIDSGPIEVVFDRSAVLGTPTILNGVSCMYCHREGMISDFRDELRGAETLGGDARKKVLELHPTHDEMQRFVRQDQAIFMQSVNTVVRPFLSVGTDSNKSASDFAEPVGKVASMYLRDLTPHEVACELGIENVDLLKGKIESNRELLRYGLGTCIQNPPGTIKREKWEARDGTSLMQDVAVELRIGLALIH